MVDKLNTREVAAPKEGNIKIFYILFLCSHSAIFLRNKITILPFCRLEKNIMAILVPISFELHEHLVCPPVLGHTPINRYFEC